MWSPHWASLCRYGATELTTPSALERPRCGVSRPCLSRRDRARPAVACSVPSFHPQWPLSRVVARASEAAPGVSRPLLCRATEMVGLVAGRSCHSSSQVLQYGPAEVECRRAFLASTKRDRVVWSRPKIDRVCVQERDGLGPHRQGPTPCARAGHTDPTRDGRRACVALTQRARRGHKSSKAAAADALGGRWSRACQHSAAKLSGNITVATFSLSHPPRGHSTLLAPNTAFSTPIAAAAASTTFPPLPSPIRLPSTHNDDDASTGRQADPQPDNSGRLPPPRRGHAERVARGASRPRTPRLRQDPRLRHLRRVWRQEPHPLRLLQGVLRRQGTRAGVGQRGGDRADGGGRQDIHDIAGNGANHHAVFDNTIAAADISAAATTPAANLQQADQ